uniref:hypothetical protein RF2 n=1 Tax=Scleria parvula TaxID=388579 RepID=UPI001F146EE5|nr:hypothetical protein RF2 [Scleria parvula]YP_010291689.1 hypothetical protein RF2 [Scleria parvula]ULQ67673.1 hypothetical protein RF2 [Scleria parvula]ULQ67696.1 hypothetical protein RF2 [Scleria parvula]
MINLNQLLLESKEILREIWDSHFFLLRIFCEQERLMKFCELRIWNLLFSHKKTNQKYLTNKGICVRDSRISDFVKLVQGVVKNMVRGGIFVFTVILASSIYNRNMLANRKNYLIEFLSVPMNLMESKEEPFRSSNIHKFVGSILNPQKGKIWHGSCFLDESRTVLLLTRKKTSLQSWKNEIVKKGDFLTNEIVVILINEKNKIKILSNLIQVKNFSRFEGFFSESIDHLLSEESEKFLSDPTKSIHSFFSPRWSELYLGSSATERFIKEERKKTFWIWKRYPDFCFAPFRQRLEHKELVDLFKVLPYFKKTISIRRISHNMLIKDKSRPEERFSEILQLVILMFTKPNLVYQRDFGFSIDSSRLEQIKNILNRNGSNPFILMNQNLEYGIGKDSIRIDIQNSRDITNLRVNQVLSNWTKSQKKWFDPRTQRSWNWYDDTNIKLSCELLDIQKEYSEYLFLTREKVQGIFTEINFVFDQFQKFLEKLKLKFNFDQLEFEVNQLKIEVDQLTNDLKKCNFYIQEFVSSIVSEETNIKVRRLKILEYKKFKWPVARSFYFQFVYGNFLKFCLFITKSFGFFAKCFYFFHARLSVHIGNIPIHNYEISISKLNGLGVQIFLSKKFKPDFFNNQKISQRLDQGSKLWINEGRIFQFLFNEISKWMIDSLMNGRKCLTKTDSFIPHDRDNWLNPVKIFQQSSTISAFYKANELRLMNEFNHFFFWISSNKKFPFLVKRTRVNNEELTYRKFLDISFIDNKRFFLHGKDFFDSIFRIEPQVSDIKIPKDLDFPKKRDNFFNCYSDQFEKYIEKWNNKLKRSFIFPNRIQSDPVLYRAGSVFTMDSKIELDPIEFDPTVWRAGLSSAEPIKLKFDSDRTMGFPKTIYPSKKVEITPFQIRSGRIEVEIDWIWNQFCSKLKKLYQYLDANSKTEMECECISCPKKSVPPGKKEKFRLFHFRNRKKNKRNVEVVVKQNFLTIRLYEGEKREKSIFYFEWTVNMDYLLSVFGERRQRNIFSVEWTVNMDYLLSVFLTGGFKQLRCILSEIFWYYVLPSLVSKIDDILDVPFIILEKIILRWVFIMDKIFSNWLVQPLRRIFHIFLNFYFNSLKKQNSSEKRRSPPFLSCSLSFYSSISYSNGFFKAPLGGGPSQRSDELLFSIPFLLLVVGYLACQSLIFIFQVLRELQINLEKIKSLTNSSYIMELQKLLDIYPIPSFRSENSVRVFLEEYITKFIYFLIELEWLPSEANPDFSDLSTSEILSRHPKEESENQNLIDLLIPYLTYLISFLRSLIPKSLIDEIAFLINTRHLSCTSKEIYSLIRKREKVVKGDFMDDRIESWVANSDWIDDEEREFLIQLSTLRTEKRIDQILWSLTHSNLLYEIVEQPGSNYLRYLFDMQKKDLLNYEFKRSCLAERRIFLAYYETIISWGSLHLSSRLNPFSLRLASYPSKSILVIGSIGIGRSYLVKSLAKNSYLPFIKIYPLKYPYLFDESSFDRNQDLDLDIENLEDFKNEGITYIPFDLDDFDVDDSGDIDDNLNLDKKLFNMTRDKLTSNNPFFFDMTVQLDLAKTMSPCIIWIPNIHDLDLNELRYLSLHLEESSLSNSKDRERCFNNNIIVIASTHIPREVDPALIGLNKFNIFIKIRRLTIPQQRQYFLILSYTRGFGLEKKIFDSKKFGSITMSSNARHLVALNNEVLSISITQRKYIIEDTNPIRLAFFRQIWDFQTHIKRVQDHRIFLYQIGRAFAQNVFLSNFLIDPISIYPTANNRILNSYSYKWYVELETDLNKITVLRYLLSCSAGLVTQDIWSSPGPDAKNWITSSEFLENDSRLIQSLLELEDVLVGSSWIKKNCSETLLLRSEPRNPLDMMQQKFCSIRYRRLRYEIEKSEFEEGHKAVNLQQIENGFFNQNQIVRSDQIWRYLFDNLEIEKIKKLMESGLPYWAKSFQGKWLFLHEEDKLEEEELQENDSESGTIQYQKRERFSKEQSFFLKNQFIWEPWEPFFLVVIWLDFCLSRREWFPDANSDEKRSDLIPSQYLSEDEKRSDLIPSRCLSEDWVNKQEKHLELLTRRQRWQRRLRINSSLSKGSFPSHILFESYQYLANLFLSNGALLDQMIKTLLRNRWLFPEDMNHLIRGTGKRFPISYP